MEIIFKTHESSLQNQELTPILIHVMVDNQTIIFPTSIIISRASWAPEHQRVKGEALRAMEHNLLLVKLETKLLEYYNTCLRKQKPVELDLLIKLLFKNDERDKQLSSEFQSPALSVKELSSLQSIQLSDKGVEKVLDVYLFICYTGVPYNYASKLDRAQLTMINSQWCLRPTTETPFTFPVRLVKRAISIIRKWEGNYKPGTEQALLPVISNLSVATVLQQLAQLAHIQTPLSWDNAIKTHWQTYLPSTAFRTS